MKHFTLAILLALATGSAAMAADTGDRGTSTYDKNPACMDRNVPANSKDCTVQNGKPRRHVVGAQQPAPVNPGAPQAGQTAAGK